MNATPIRKISGTSLFSNRPEGPHGEWVSVYDENRVQIGTVGAPGAGQSKWTVRNGPRWERFDTLGQAALWIAQTT